MATEARRLGLGVMVGNMVGTSLAMAPAFILGQLCDFVDLDGPTFLERGPRAGRRLRRTARSGARTRSGARGRGGDRRNEPRERTWFGQPRGLTILFLTNMWEQFSYFGMRALLVYYMTTTLLFDQEKASSIYGFYTAFAYFTPIIGGTIADRWLGKRRAVIIGATRHGRGPFHDGVRAGLLFRAGDDRAWERPVPADPAEPDQRPLRRRRPAAPVGLQRLLCRRERRRLPRAPGLRLPRRNLRLALRLRRCRRRHARRPCSSILWGQRHLPREQRSCRSRCVPQPSALQTRPRHLPAAARHRPRGHRFPRRLRADRQYVRAVDARRRQPRDRRRRDRRGDVLLAEPAAGHGHDAVASGALEASGRARPRAVGDAQDGGRRIDRRRVLPSRRSGRDG